MREGAESVCPEGELPGLADGLKRPQEEASIPGPLTWGNVFSPLRTDSAKEDPWLLEANVSWITGRSAILVAKKACLSGLGISRSAPRGGKTRGLLVSNVVFSRDLQAHSLWPWDPAPKPVLCLCSMGSVRGLRLGLGFI